jgi:hypothetical protein
MTKFFKKTTLNSGASLAPPINKKLGCHYFSSFYGLNAVVENSLSPFSAPIPSAFSLNLLRLSFGSIHKRSFSSSSSRFAHRSNPFVSNLLHELKGSLVNLKFVANMDTQLFIERSISDMFSSDIQNSSQFVAGVNLDKVSSPVVRYLIDQNSTVEFYIGKLLASLAEVRIEESMLMLDILHSLDLDFIRGYCYYIFLICLTCRHTDDDDKLVNLIKIAVKIGKEFARKHFLTCFELEFKGVDFDKRPRYSI